MKSMLLLATLTLGMASSSWMRPAAFAQDVPRPPPPPSPSMRPPPMPALRLPTVPGAFAHANASANANANKRTPTSKPRRQVRRARPGVPEVPAPIELSVTPKQGYLYDLTLRATQSWGDVDVVFDRRLLTLSVKPTGSKRSYKCSYTGAPTRVRPARVEHLEGGTKTFTEWFDIRMYCWGRALTALDEGGEVQYAYGFSSASKNRWIAKRTEASLTGLTPRERRKAAKPLGRVSGAQPLVVAPRAAAAPVAAAVRPVLRPTDITVSGGLTFHVAIHATDEKRRVYLRGDMVSFDITGPLGHVVCQREHQAIVPIADFFSMAAKTSGPSVHLDARAICPAHTFAVEGIYEVRPFVVLPYDGTQWRYNAASGRFDGEMSPVRVRDPEGPYVDHSPN